MHARLTRTTQRPETLDSTISTFEQSVAEPVRKQQGCAGLGLAVSREDGTAISFTLWETEQAMQASEERAQTLRADLAAEQGFEVVAVERYEVAHIEGAFKPGSFTRLTSGRIAPERIAEMQDHLQQQVLPLLRRQRGFLRASAFVDRANGNFVLASGWETPEDREASDAAISSLRQELTQALDASLIRVEPYELVFADVSIVSGVRT
jgi:quinol monooxygenase YgiN